MQTQNCINIFFFSPTHSSERIARAVADGTGIRQVTETNLTTDDGTAPICAGSALSVIAVPVYRGRVAPLALERLKRLRADSAPAILVVTYGNRDYEDALLELSDTAKGLGFIPVAAAAFIGEHSYSTHSMPTAEGRPDDDDIRIASGFGQRCINKLSRYAVCPEGLAGMPGLHVRGHNPYREVKLPEVKTVPECNGSCILCGECIGICPAHALAFSPDGSGIVTDPDLCICCCACVKACPAGARTYNTPFTAYLHENFSARKEPELFL